MTPLKQSNNFAARMGRWSASHWKTAVFGWLAFVIASVAIGGVVGSKTLDATDTIPGESGRATRILDAEFPQAPRESVIVRSETLTADDPAFKAAIYDVITRVSRLSAVDQVRSPLDQENAGQISPDGHAALIQVEITGELVDAADVIVPVEEAVAGAQSAHPGFYVGTFGDGSAARALDESFARDLEKAGLLSLPVTLVILVLAFGALVAAGIPLLLALSAVIATMGLIALPSQILPIDEGVGAVVLLIGLAVGVDYTLFYLKREREERAAGRSERAALEAAAATSGRSVLISGLTVMASMAGMFLTGDKGFSSMAMATIMVVAIAVLGSLTVLPALLSKLGDRVDRARVPFLHRLRRDDGESRFWNFVLDRVLRRPLLSAVLSAGLLIAIALPALGMKTVMPGAEAFPRSLEVMQVYDKVQESFPGEQIPASVVIKGDLASSQMEAAVADLRKQALATGLMYEPISVLVNNRKTAARIDIPVAGEGTDSTSNAALAKLREEIVPLTVGAVPGTETAVTGMTAISKDFNAQMKASAPLVFAFVLLLAFILLLVSFRSIVIALKAIVLNLLSVGAAYGILVLVFQHGWGKGLLGFDYTGGVMAFLPIFLFVILFGLSMDYHVFILSRIREAYDRGMSTEDAVAHGIKTTAGVVTSAAIVMVFVFSIFGTLSMIMLKQFGVGLAAAVLIDATIVRGVLLPATMKLLGDWNWYLPRWLEWLPQLESEAPPEAPAVPNPA